MKNGLQHLSKNSSNLFHPKIHYSHTLAFLLRNTCVQECYETFTTHHSLLHPPGPQQQPNSSSSFQKTIVRLPYCIPTWSTPSIWHIIEFKMYCLPVLVYMLQARFIYCGGSAVPTHPPQFLGCPACNGAEFWYPVRVNHKLPIQPI